MRTYYPKVPLGSLLWAIARIPGSTLKPNAAPSFTLPGGIDIGLPRDSDVVVSLRMLTTIHARADFYTHSEEAARNFTDQMTTFLAVFRGIQANTAAGPGDADVKAVFDSIKVTQNGDRAEVLATIPPASCANWSTNPRAMRCRASPQQAQPAKSDQADGNLSGALSAPSVFQYLSCS